jgi:hypothetical protein
MDLLTLHGTTDVFLNLRVALAPQPMAATSEWAITQEHSLDLPASATVTVTGQSQQQHLLLGQT